jgi:hypothetical protein
MIDKNSPYVQNYLNTLTDAIMASDIEAIENWFSYEDMSDANKEFRRIVYFHIKLHKPNVFTYHIDDLLQSTLNFDDYYPTIKKDAQVKLRDLAVMKHFGVEQQLDFISAMAMDRLDTHHIQALDFEAGNFSQINLFQKHSNSVHLLATLLYQENFEALELLAEKMQINPLAFKFEKAVIFSDFLHDIDPFKTQTIFWMDGYDFSVQDTLMIHYTQDKQAWFNEQGFAIPEASQLEEFKKMIMNKVAEEQPASWAAYWHQAFRPYEVKLSFDRLNQSIQSRYATENEENNSANNAIIDEFQHTAKLKI